MIKQDIFKLISDNPVFYLATVDNDQPRVRAMFLYRADETGIIFHTATMKEVHEQITKNNKVELCFSCNGIQIRISGELTLIDSDDLRNEICEHPSRKFLKDWREKGFFEDFHKSIAVYILKNGIAKVWTMDKNFEPKDIVEL